MDQYSQDPLNAVGNDDSARGRNESRDSLFLMADFRLPDSPVVTPVRVRNLSAGGLMAELSAEMELGQSIEFDVRGIGWISGKVAWSAEGRIGVAFDRQIDPMLARKPVSSGTKTPVLVKPIFPRR